MTTVPTTMGPTDATIAVLGTGPDLSGSSAPSAAADFLAAILQALAPGGPGAATAADPTAAGSGADADASDASDASGPTDAAQDATALGLVPPGVAVAVGAAAAGGAAGTAGAAGAAGATPAAGPANVAAGAAGATTSPTGDIRMPVYDAAATGSPADVVAAAAGRPLAAGPANVAAGAAEATTSPTGDIRMSAYADKAADPGASNTPVTVAPDPAQPAAAPTVPVPTPSSGPAHAAPAAPAAHVARQVFPEVTSLMTRGDGTHRITLTLKPEALGEVRVVMTVRDGAVHVRLAAGHEAQQSLLQGSHELGRLLEAAGATETRVVVRDLGSANATAAAGPDLSQGLGDPRPQDQHAGTRAQHPATDGTNDTRATRGTTGANPPRSVEPVTHSRTAGVDVTM